MCDDWLGGIYLWKIHTYEGDRRTAGYIPEIS